MLAGDMFLQHGCFFFFFLLYLLAQLRIACVACHSIGHGDKIGPDLLGVNHVRSQQWLTQIIQHPDQLLEKNDPIATTLLKKYNVRMPNIYMSDVDTGYILRYIEEQTAVQEKQTSNGNATKVGNH